MLSTALKQSRGLSRSNLELYQVRAVEYVNNHHKAALWVDCGLGKTAVTLTAIADQFDSLMVNKVLVVAPKKVAEDTWPDEINKWSGLFSFNVRSALILGDQATRLKALHKDADIYIINVENLVWLIDTIGKHWPFDWVVFDESSLFKAHNTKRFKAMKKVMSKVNWVTQLTGTPATNGLMNVWSQIFLLDQGERLERTITNFRRKYFDHYMMGDIPKYVIRPGADELIHEQLKDIVFRLDANDYLKMEPLKRIFHSVKLSTKARRFYEQLAEDLIIQLQNDQTITAPNAAVLTNKLLQCANGAVYIDDLRDWQHIHDDKLDLLEHIVAETDGPVLVAYNFRSDLERLQKRFPQGVNVKDDNAVIRWNSGEIPMLFVHPASAGHGLNLQFGGNVIVWFGLNWSLEFYMQLNARLRRKGQTKPVFCHHLVAENTVDETVIKALDGKEITQTALLDALKKQVNL